MPVLSLGDEFTVAANPTDGSNLEPENGVSVAGKPDGRFLVTWVQYFPEPRDSDDFPVYFNDVLGQLYDGQTAVGASFVVNDDRGGETQYPQVASLTEGYAAAYWRGYGFGGESSYTANALVRADDGTLLGSETASGVGIPQKAPDIAVLGDGSFVVVSGQEERGIAQVRDVSGLVTGGFEFGRSSEEDFGAPETSVAAVGGDDLLVFWTGLAPATGPVDGSGEGLWVQQRDVTGAVGATTKLATLADADHFEVTARTLLDGHVVVAWESLQGGFIDVFATILSSAGVPLTPAFRVDGTAANDSFQPEVAVLDTGDFVVTWSGVGSGVGDGAGSAIRARVFHADGAAVGDAFTVNQVAAGDQVEPSVAAVGGGRFAVAWGGPDGIKARLFDTTPDCPLFTRPGTLDLSAAGNQVLTGSGAANSFFVDLAARSGRDVVTDFGRDDVLLTTAALTDRNGDGVVGFGRNGVLDLGQGDAVRLGGVGALRLLGRCDGLFVYADAAVRPKDAIEGGLAAETLRGDASDAVRDMFFRDTGLGASFGDDAVVSFGERDILVTTTALADGDGDGIISFGANQRLDVGGDVVDISGPSGGRITSLEFDGGVAHGGVTYFVYSRVGSAAGVGDLHFG